jgi:hypothetical protein
MLDMIRFPQDFTPEMKIQGDKLLGRAVFDPSTVREHNGLLSVFVERFVRPDGKVDSILSEDDLAVLREREEFKRDANERRAQAVREQAVRE